jgi:hypothetical protein
MIKHGFVLHRIQLPYYTNKIHIQQLKKILKLILIKITFQESIFFFNLKFLGFNNSNQ